MEEIDYDSANLFFAIKEDCKFLRNAISSNILFRCYHSREQGEL